MNSFTTICFCVLVVTVLHSKLSDCFKNDNRELNRQKRLTLEEVTKSLNRPVPDFRGPGRRISDIKCYEYIWQMTEVKNKRKIYYNWLFDFLKSDEERQEAGRHLVRKLLRPPSEYPHVGAIGWRVTKDGHHGTFKCGCTLISPKFALTAARCTKLSENDTSVYSPIPNIVRFGDSNINDTNLVKKPAVIVKIKRFVLHPKYKAPSMNYDIALIEFQTDLKIDRFIRPACLWKNVDTTSLGISAEVAEWKFIQTGNSTSWHKLQIIPVDLTESQICYENQGPWCNRYWCGSQNHQFCAGKLDREDNCQGDTGGPLQVQIPLPDVNTEGNLYYVIGVASVGINCGPSPLPGIYTRVSSVLDWIESVVWPQS